MSLISAHDQGCKTTAVIPWTLAKKLQPLDIPVNWSLQGVGEVDVGRNSHLHWNGKDEEGHTHWSLKLSCSSLESWENYASHKINGFSKAGITSVSAGTEDGAIKRLIQ